MITPRRLFLFWLLILLSVSPVFTQSPSDKVRDFLDSAAVWAAQARQPGIGIAIVSSDSVVYAGGVGWADVANQIPVQATTGFRVGSVSKIFVSLGVLRLVEQGKFSLQDKLADLAPEVQFTNAWEAQHSVTVADLLEHTAGFDDMHFRNIYNKHDDPYLPLSQVLDRSQAALTSRWQPQSRHSYSNPGYTVLGYLIEKFSGLPFEDYMQKEVLQHLGMKNSSFRLTPAIESSLSKGYRGNDSTEVKYFHIYHRPAGSLHSTPADLARAMQMFLHRGQVDSLPFLKEASLERMERSHQTWASQKGFPGYGLGNYPGDVKGHRSQGHNGGIEGFYSQFRYFPEAGTGYLLLFNRLDADRKLRTRIEDAVFRLILPEKAGAIPVPVALAPALSAEYSGYFTEGNPRNEIFSFLTSITSTKMVGFIHDTLQVNATFGDNNRYVPLSQETYRDIEGPEVRTVLGKWDDGQIYLQEGGQFSLQTSGGLVWTGWLGLLFFFLLQPAGLLFGLISLFLKARGKLKGAFLPRMFLGLAPIFLTAAIFAAFSLDLVTIGEVTTAAVLVFIGLLGFGLCSVCGAGGTFWQILRHRFNGARIFMLVLSGFYLAGTIYLALHGLMPLRLWMW